MDQRYDVFVVGGGGTGSEVAFSLRRQDPGLSICIAERDKFGGECNHYGCVPTKVMLHSAKVAATARTAGRFGVRVHDVSLDFPAVMARARAIIDAQSGEQEKPFLDNGIEVITDEVRLIGPTELEVTDGRRILADKIVLATGSEATCPPIPGLEGTPFWTNKEAIWTPTEVPRSLAVLGTGAIGTEFAQIYARFGAEVTQVEIAPHILPLEDAEAAASMVPALEEDGITIREGATSCEIHHSGDGTWKVHIEEGDDIRADELLVATGRKPCFDEHDLAAAGVELDETLRPILDETLRTTAPGIWAGGDATGDLLFTHVGGYEAEIIVQDILGRRTVKDYRVVPRVTFTDPEIASVGLTEDGAREAGHEVKTGVARFEWNERAEIDGSTVGLVKVVADARTGELLGGHIVGQEAGAMIHEIVAAMAGRVPTNLVGDAIHAYPTLSESVKSAFLQLEEG